MKECVFAIQQIGPYHHDRFQALAKSGLIVKVIETRPNDKTYSWHTEFSNREYTTSKFTGNPFAIYRQLRKKTVYICGWFDWEMILILIYGVLFRCNRVIISDSKWNDAVRTWHKEIIKSFVLKFYHAALVAGRESNSYLKKLGFKKNIFTPWDVVAPVELVVQQTINQWVFPARLVPKKNHKQFLQLYAKFYFRSSTKPNLLVCGDGILEAELKSLVNDLGINNCVSFLGFVQSQELLPIMSESKLVVLPSVSDQWGLVVNEALDLGVPVLVSSGCGAKELLDDTRNGWVVNFQKKESQLVEEFLTIERQLNEKEPFLPQAFSMQAFVVSVNKICGMNV